MNCFKCKGPFHLATGHVFKVFGLEIPYCGPCAHEAMDYIRGRTAPRRRNKALLGGDFYEAAATAIRADGGNCSGCGCPPLKPYGLCLDCQDDADVTENLRLDIEFYKDAG